MSLSSAHPDPHPGIGVLNERKSATLAISTAGPNPCVSRFRYNSAYAPPGTGGLGWEKPLQSIWRRVVYRFPFSEIQAVLGTRRTENGILRTENAHYGGPMPNEPMLTAADINDHFFEVYPAAAGTGVRHRRHIRSTRLGHRI